jgi:hypothetical protein
MKTPKKKPSVAQKSAAYSKMFPPHPRQADLIAASIKLLADDVASAATPEAPVTDADTMTGAKAEFDTGLVVLIYPPKANRFYAVWSSPAWARMLKPYLKAAWQSEPGAYGDRPPISYDPKRKPINLR